ncbi:Cytochrome P450 CYP4/CYP19/CYP26 subfamilies [Phaffia rhodozyma]|uniref:Cytochrome P450 CYP4/CYP19/CYP26 subfamilies n=1 Tax=Phaffia rhodozyma TaxID=264483 RepID=A0A0F7SS91_PHARH|nr:Cytochrome P450 CYP4/CYP19/CYP26 subfamilies [Phaffia rhodozyma]
MSSLQTSFITAAVCVLAAAIVHYVLRPGMIKNIPSRPMLPILGHAHELIRHMYYHETVSDYFVDSFVKPLGPLSQFMKSAYEPVLIVADKRLNDQILNSKDWDRGALMQGIFGGVTPKGMLAIKTDSMLRLHRRALAPSMSPAFISISADVFAIHMARLMSLWKVKLQLASECKFGAGEQIADVFWDAEGDLHMLTTDAISQIVFGESFDQLPREIQLFSESPSGTFLKLEDLNRKPGSKGQSEIAGYMDDIFHSLSSGIAPGLKHAIQRLKPSYQRAFGGFRRWLIGRVDESRKKIKNGGEIAEITCVIDVILAKEAKAGVGSVLPEDELWDELGTFMVAGEETTSTTMCWILKFLSENPHVQSRLHEEMTRSLPSSDERNPNYDDIVGNGVCDYLEAVVYESLRHGETVRAVGRQSIRETTVTGPDGQEHLIPAGVNAMCLLNTSCAVYSDDPKLGWRSDKNDIHRFNPDRWLRPDGTFDKDAGPMLSFAAGPRACFGLKMALVFLRLFTAQLVMAFALAPLSSQYSTEDSRAVLTRRPTKNWVGVRTWSNELKNGGFDEGCDVKRTV